MRSYVFTIILTILFHFGAKAQETVNISESNTAGIIFLTVLTLVAIILILYRRQKRRFND